MLKQRLAASAASLALVGFLAAPVLDPAPAQARIVPPPKPAVLTDVNWHCIAGTTTMGIGVVALAIVPPAGLAWNIVLWGTVGYDAYDTAGACMGSPQNPGVVCGAFKYSSVNGDTKYFDNGCQVQAGGGGGGSWGGPFIPPIGGGGGGGSW